MATSNFTITLTITHAVQATADALRDAALADYCKAYNIDIYVTPNVPESGIDVPKAAAAIRAHVQQHFRNVVKDYRGRLAGDAAEATAKASAATELA